MNTFKEFVLESGELSISIWDINVSKKAEEVGKRIQKSIGKGLDVNDALYKELISSDKKTLKDKKNYPGSAFGKLQKDIVKYLVKNGVIQKPGDIPIDFITKDEKTQEFVMKTKFKKK